MKWLVRLSINKPIAVISGIAILTAIFGYIIYIKFSIEIDPTKSFSRKMEVIKYYQLTMKKFTMQDTILIGVENSKDGVYNKETLRYIDSIMEKIKDLKIIKKYNNIITQENEYVEVPSEISSNNIMSITNADDVTVDKSTNTIVIGNLTRKARKAAGLADPDSNIMDSLPKDDGDLDTFIPYLKDELEKNELFKGTLISNDGKACAVLVPIEKRLDNKIEILRRELSYMIDANKLKRRFEGKDFNFHYKIYNKTIGNITVNDEFINDKVASNKKSIRNFFTDLFDDFEDYYKDFYSFLETAEVNEEYLSRALGMIETDAMYEIEEIDITYEDTIDTVYDFVIEKMDRFSKNSLETQLYNIKDIYDVGYMYKLLKQITEKNKPEGIKIYIAGRPIAEALLEEFIVNDMSVFMLFTIVVIMIILFLSFSTLIGIFLPLVSVLISVICLMGSMLLFGMEFSSGTITVPSILIAVGSAYVIHYLARYYEVTLDNGVMDVKDALLQTTVNIKVAINLSAVTTIAAFLSVVSSDVIDIKMLGILISIGIIFTVILTYSFVPAVLALLPRPKSRKHTKAESLAMKGALNVGSFTFNHSRLVFIISMIITIAIAVGLIFLKTESSITYMFMENNPIRVADRFINKNLTGTGQMCIVFKMRDRVNITSETAQKDLDQRISGFGESYEGMLRLYPQLRISPHINNFVTGLEKLKSDPVKNQTEIEKRVAVMTDILNEYYEVEPEKKEIKKQKTNGEGIDDLSAMADDTAMDRGVECETRETSPTDEGIKEIIKRIGGIESDTDIEKAQQYIISIRNNKNSDYGKEFLGKFYLLSDFFQTDIKQPITLHKIDVLGKKLQNLEEPKAYIGDVAVKPVGNILSITDTLKVIYRVFYHDDNEDFNKLPEVSKDGFRDKSLTDRSIIGVCVNQFRASREDVFKYLVTDDLKLLQYVVFMRSDKADFLKSFENSFYSMARKLFPKNDPYIENIVISGLPAINMAMNQQLYYQQIQSLLITIFVVFIVCLVIFRSFAGGIMSIIPISFTVIINLGIMGWLDFPISYSTVIIASIAIGAGIDYTLHFMLRFKYEHIKNCLDFKDSYFKTLKTTGNAIIISAVSVAGGFAVLAASTFKMIRVSGLMVALAMILSATASLTVLPALMNWLKPEFLKKKDNIN